ncbi:class I SAM-dependent methyltransferase (plasmid) [Phormidium sp. CLA17]|uniref:class I SAM-dependent methyltransferase n=1 Tax=Leptolyngbya sp. Cla-17 TaxID=2803751 RepID=UPI00149268B4|nr:class I SAM-dependent methyltransferase [Leptolyngbya sp. Cla-17]MBM0745305.1 class I SAM-dependent methyltransferase [Leptolyngbya sp. Cla-17]
MTAREFPNWEALYQEKSVETMPWFNPDLDPDVEEALIVLDLNSGTLLDLGTGPGTQAIALAERGFQVIATDLSETAIRQAAEKGLEISFRQDDILNSHLDRSFDLILDRGCFHGLLPQRRDNYVQTVANLLKPKKYLLLKCFSQQQPGEQGPYRFTPEEIQQIFTQRFHLRSVAQTVYQGTLDPLLKALFCILEKR